MRVRSLSLIAPVSQRILPSLNAKNIHKFINKIPCNAQQLRTPPSVQYVLQQMQQYPLTHDPAYRNFLDQGFPLQQKGLVELIQQLSGKLNYLEMEQLRELLERMPSGEAQNHRKVLKQFHKKIYTKIEKHRLSEYVLQAARNLMEQVNRILKQKSVLIV